MMQRARCVAPGKVCGRRNADLLPLYKLLITITIRLGTHSLCPFFELDAFNELIGVVELVELADLIQSLHRTAPHHIPTSLYTIQIHSVSICIAGSGSAALLPACLCVLLP